MTTRKAEKATALTQLSAQLGGGRLLRDLLAITGDDLVIVDTEWRICFCGAHVAALLGYSVEEMLEQFPFNLLPLDQPIHDPYFPPRLIGKLGNAVAVDGTVKPLSNDAGETQGYACIVRQAVVPREETPSASVYDEAHIQILEESNHRVRNNLALICALLDMEMLQAPEGERERLLLSLARTRSLAVVHNLVESVSGQVEVSILARAVIDSVRALFPRIDAPVVVSSQPSIFLSARRATYLSLSLTELATHFIRCALAHQTPAFPTIQVEESAGTMSITLSSPACAADHACDGLAPLSREIIKGLVERSLNGHCELSVSAPFHAVIRCPLDTPSTSRCE